MSWNVISEMNLKTFSFMITNNEQLHHWFISKHFVKELSLLFMHNTSLGIIIFEN